MRRSDRGRDQVQPREKCRYPTSLPPPLSLARSLGEGRTSPPNASRTPNTNHSPRPTHSQSTRTSPSQSFRLQAAAPPASLFRCRPARMRLSRSTWPAAPPSPPPPRADTSVAHSQATPLPKPARLTAHETWCTCPVTPPPAPKRPQPPRHQPLPRKNAKSNSPRNQRVIQWRETRRRARQNPQVRNMPTRWQRVSLEAGRAANQ